MLPRGGANAGRKPELSHWKGFGSERRKEGGGCLEGLMEFGESFGLEQKKTDINGELKRAEEGKVYSALCGTQRAPAMTEEAFSLAPVPAGVSAGPLRVSDLYSSPGDSWRCQHCTGLSCTSSLNREFVHAEAPLSQQEHIMLTHHTTFPDLFFSFSSNPEL